MKKRSSKERSSQAITLPKYAKALSKEWKLLGDRLALAIADLDEDEYLIVGEKTRNVYVQFSAQGFFGMRMEAVSNEFLEQDDKLSKEELRSLRSLGWRPPTYVRSKVAQEPPVGSCNYYLDADNPVPYKKMASIAMETLQNVYRTRHPTALQYKAFSSTGYLIRFPTLGLKRDPSEVTPAE